jgi:alanyl-tRNA synthetase
VGEHAKQSGSHVSAERLRFDFANPTELGPERLRQVEDLAKNWPGLLEVIQYKVGCCFYHNQDSTACR